MIQVKYEKNNDILGEIKIRKKKIDNPNLENKLRENIKIYFVR
jgi:hypothetical protein